MTEKVTKKVLAFFCKKSKTKKGFEIREGSAPLLKMSQLAGIANVTDSLCVEQSQVMLLRNSRTVTVGGVRQISLA